MICTDDKKLEQLKNFIESVVTKPHSDSYLIAVLHKAQELYGYLPRDIMDVISERMNIPTANIWGAATFYHYFNLNPPGKYTISICLGTACYVKGANDVLTAIKNHLKIDLGQTTEDGLFSLQPARCLGACGLAPVIMIEDKIHGDLTPKTVVKLLEEYRKKGK
jgi:NADH-quinone oxidoreductase subunit E/NADP-reducing hydrogenase subunit HndA